MIETTRLRLRRLLPSDVPDLIALDSDPAVMRFVGSPPGTRTPEESSERVRQRVRADHDPYGFWLVEGKADGAFHGLGLLMPIPEGDEIEVGYRLARRSWGRGIATEVTAALIDHAFRHLALPRLVAVVYPDNRASRRVLDKLGFTHDGPREYKGARVEHYTLPAASWRGCCAGFDKGADAPP